MNTMRAQDAIAGEYAECFITLNDKRINFMQAENVEATVDKNKKEIKILGRTMVGNKSVSAKGTGKAKFHYNTSIFREVIYDFVKTGSDLYFDMQITNEDPNSAAGRQTTILEGCNIDGSIVAKFDVDADVLEEEINFTFENMKLPETFETLEGME